MYTNTYVHIFMYMYTHIHVYLYIAEVLGTRGMATFFFFHTLQHTLQHVQLKKKLHYFIVALTYEVGYTYLRMYVCAYV